MSTAAQTAQTQSGQPVTAAAMAAKIVGRWPNGTPLVAFPDAPEPGIYRDALNHFRFDNPLPSAQLSSDHGPVHLPAVPGDIDGLRCPHLAHIRQINPRDAGTDIGDFRRTLTRLILRRGIPFGPLYDEQPEAERGLLFLCYQTSIDRQFRFLQRNWANSPTRPAFAGHDVIIGRTATPDNARFGELTIHDTRVELSFSGDWVIPTGGLYLATPSRAGLRELFAGALG